MNALKTLPPREVCPIVKLRDELMKASITGTVQTVNNIRVDNKRTRIIETFH